jgi:uncharacterized SAM-binding protein YcdF (DUF218 family)
MDTNLSWLATNLAAVVLLPPFNLILMMSAGSLLLRRRPRLGRTLLVVGIGALYILSTPLVAGALLRLLQTEPLPANADVSGVGAIVVLGAGRYQDAPEYGGDTANALGLERLRYAAQLQKKTGLPILATGGSPAGGVPEARFMRHILEQEFGVSVQWSEEHSNNTRDNASMSHVILAERGIHKILLVTHAWHMPRAQRAFEHAGFTVVPAGTHFAPRDGTTLLDLLPEAGALRASAYAFHELIGIVWYRFTE